MTKEVQGKPAYFSVDSGPIVLSGPIVDSGPMVLSGPMVDSGPMVLSGPMVDSGANSGVESLISLPSITLIWPRNVHHSPGRFRRQ